MGNPRPLVEVPEIAKWLYRKQIRRLALGEQQGRFSMIQAKRQAKWAESMRERNAKRDRVIVRAIRSGRSLRDVGREYGLTKRGVRWIIRREFAGRPASAASVRL